MPNNNSQPSADRPLSGLTAVEIGTSVAAPYAGLILAGLGADLVKIERAGSGDDARAWGKLFPDGTASLFHALNAGKRSVSLDLRNDEQRQWLTDYCVNDADIVLQNMRPGAIGKLGLGAMDLRAANPRLIYANMWAFGAKGPLKDKPGYDPLMQAYGGLMSMTGEAGRPPVRIGTSIVDMGTGLWTVIGILSAVNRRHATGEGCEIDTALYETALGWMTNPVSNVQADGVNPEREGSGARGMAPYQAYECQDDWLVVAAPNDGLFNKLAALLGHEEWLEDERFNVNQQRYTHLDALNERLDPIFKEQPRAHWQALLDEAGIPNAPVQSTVDMMNDPQTQALGILQTLPTQGPKVMGLPLHFNGVRPTFDHHAPALGNANEALLKGHQKK